MQVTCLVLVQFVQSGESIGPLCILDDCPKWLYASGVSPKKRDFGVTALGTQYTIELGPRHIITYLGTSRYLRWTRPASKLGSIQAIEPS